MTQKAYSIPEFLQAYRLSRSKLYDLWKAGHGPMSYRIGRKRMISTDAAEAWLDALEHRA
jgi:predicted DNA-binding transcriptional regulator AlpA